MVDDSPSVDARVAASHDATVGRRAGRAVDRALPRPRTLWSLAVLAMVLDVAITGVGLSLGLTERNRIARAFIDGVGLVAAGILLKGVVLAIGYACWRLVPVLGPVGERHRDWVPVGIALPSWIAVGINAVTILAVV